MSKTYSAPNSIIERTYPMITSNNHKEGCFPGCFYYSDSCFKKECPQTTLGTKCKEEAIRALQTRRKMGWKHFHYERAASNLFDSTDEPGRCIWYRLRAKETQQQNAILWQQEAEMRGLFVSLGLFSIHASNRRRAHSTMER